MTHAILTQNERRIQLGRLVSFQALLTAELKNAFDKETAAGRLSAEQIADRKHVLACIARNKSK